jgi:hypothetical protein
VVKVKVKLSLCYTKHHAIKTHGGGDIDYVFLITTLDGGEWSASLSGRFTSGETAPSTHCIGGQVGYRAGLDTVAKKKNIVFAPTGNRNPVVQPIVFQVLNLL